MIPREQSVRNNHVITMKFRFMMVTVPALAWPIVLCLMVLTSDELVAQASNEPFRWLEGTWKITTAKGQIVETWKAVNDSTYQGRSLFVRAAGDSSLQETLRLERSAGEWSYISAVVGQNDNKPVFFSLIYVGKEEFISENLHHDFPQRITYRRWKDHILASIEGRNNSRYAKRNFDYERVR